MGAGRVRPLLGLGLQASGKESIRVFDLTAAFAVFGMKEIAQDREEPGLQIGVAPETVKVGNSPEERECVSWTRSSALST